MYHSYYVIFGEKKKKYKISKYLKKFYLDPVNNYLKDM